MLGQTTFLVSATQSDPVPAAVSAPAPPSDSRPSSGRSWPSRSSPVRNPSPDLARQHQVSRKFLYQQADTARLALDRAFDPPQPDRARSSSTCRSPSRGSAN